MFECERSERAARTRFRRESPPGNGAVARSRRGKPPRRDGRAPQRRDARLSNAGRRRATSTATGRASGVTRPRRGTLRYERRNSQRGLVSRQLRFETAPMGIRSRGEADVAGDSTPWATSLFRSSRSFQTAPSIAPAVTSARADARPSPFARTPPRRTLIAVGMSADAPAKRDVSPTRAVGTARKAETPNGEASKRAKVSADDLARALGGTTPEPAPKPLAPAVPQGPDFGLKEVRARDAASALLAPSFSNAPRQISPDALAPRGRPTSHPPSRPLSLPPPHLPPAPSHAQGDRLEVRWVISEADDDAPASPARETVVWWGCELRAPPASAASPRGPGVWELPLRRAPRRGLRRGGSRRAPDRARPPRRPG